MKKILLVVILIFLSGCTSKLYLEIYNNSNATLTIKAIDEVQVEPGESVEVKIFTSTNSLSIQNDAGNYEYSLNIGEVPGTYFISGASHKLKLQIEPALSIYVVAPKTELPVKNFEGVDQPQGFPIKPNVTISQKRRDGGN